MKISVSSYSFRSAIASGKLTQFDTVAAARGMGFSAIEFIELSPEYGKKPTYEEQVEAAKLIREEAERFGMEINAYTIGANLYRTGDDAEMEIERLCRQLDIAKILGAPVMRHDVCYSLEKGRSFYLMLPTIAENIRRVSDYAQELGIKTCSENHGFIAQDSTRIEDLFCAVNHENYGILVDIGNFACVDEDPVIAVSRVAPYAFHVHAKDFKIYPFGKRNEGLETRACNRLEGCAIGEGDIPVEQCLAILAKARYDGYVSIEYEGSKDPFDGIKIGMKALQKYGIEL